MVDALKECVQPIHDTNAHFDSPVVEPRPITENPFFVDHDDNDPDRNFRAPLIVWEKILGNVNLLTNDDRMREAYALLTHEFETDEQWRDFFASALKADVNYTRHRNAIKRGKELAPKIASTAASLAKLLSVLME